MVLYEEKKKACKAIKHQIINKGNQAHYDRKVLPIFLTKIFVVVTLSLIFLKEGDHLSSVNLDSINHGSMENF